MEFLVDFALGLSTGERLLYIALVTYLVYRGFIKLPFVNIKKKTDTKASIDRALMIWELKTRTTLYEQMNVVEVAHSAILFKMKAIYSSLTANLDDIQHYEYLVNDMEGHCKSFIRKWLKENHLTSRTDLEFNVYIEEKIDFLLELVILELNKFYRDEFFEISRHDLQIANQQQLIPYAKERWEKMFREARMISENNEKKVKELEAGC